MLLFLLVSAMPLQSIPQDSTSSSPSNAAIILKIDAAVHDRSSNITSYSVKEQYSIYRNGESDPSAQETVQTDYTVANGKQYTPIAQSGSALLRSNVIDKVLAGEKEMAMIANRESVWVTSANYEMTPENAPVQFKGHTCLIIDLKPKRKSPHLFTGREWVDASDFTVVHLEGVPSQNPSFFAGATAVSRDYEKIDGFSMATHAEAHSHSFLLGKTDLKIDYTGYQIQHR